MVDAVAVGCKSMDECLQKLRTEDGGNLWQEVGPTVDS